MWSIHITGEGLCYLNALPNWKGNWWWHMDWSYDLDLPEKIMSLFPKALVVITRLSFKRLFTKICKTLPNCLFSVVWSNLNVSLFFIHFLLVCLVCFFLFLFLFGRVGRGYSCLFLCWRTAVLFTFCTLQYTSQTNFVHWMDDNEFLVFRNMTETGFIKHWLNIRGLYG